MCVLGGGGYATNILQKIQQFWPCIHQKVGFLLPRWQRRHPFAVPPPARWRSHRPRPAGSREQGSQFHTAAAHTPCPKTPCHRCWEAWSEQIGRLSHTEWWGSLCCPWSEEINDYVQNIAGDNPPAYNHMGRVRDGGWETCTTFDNFPHLASAGLLWS